jgi:ABC-type multidrug transport system ATPase subunit
MTLFVTTHYMDEAERCTHVGYIHMSKLVVCGEPDDLKLMKEVNPAGTKRWDITCEHVTAGMQAMRQLAGVRNTTVFGQSMHLLVDEAMSEQMVRDALSKAGIKHVDIRTIGPSLEDVFVALTVGANNGDGK